MIVEKGDTTAPTKNNNPYTIPFSVKCYRCGEVGHRSNECPKRKAVNMVEREDDVFDDEVYGPDGDNNDYKYDDRDKYAYVVRKLILLPKSVDDTQCHKLFYTRCKLQ